MIRPLVLQNMVVSCILAQRRVTILFFTAWGAQPRLHDVLLFHKLFPLLLAWAGVDCRMQESWVMLWRSCVVGLLENHISVEHAILYLVVLQWLHAFHQLRRPLHLAS